ncbi:Hypothetical_protein [Hexamita inflata]|uniref:Hypothetical_protein n=1 Tax=Hexamita inflata TaxID=28002 RepID=A0AA86QCP1_9EUKA|nr:Hypothetical protein HINF_LOCUS41427 [Hexamita inflata]
MTLSFKQLLTTVNPSVKIVELHKIKFLDSIKLELEQIYTLLKNLLFEQEILNINNGLTLIEYYCTNDKYYLLLKAPQDLQNVSYTAIPINNQINNNYDCFIVQIAK